MKYTPIPGRSNTSLSENEARVMIQGLMTDVPENEVTVEAKPVAPIAAPRVEQKAKTREAKPKFAPLPPDSLLNYAETQRKKSKLSFFKKIFAANPIRRKHLWWALTVGLAIFRPVWLAIFVCTVTIIVSLAFIFAGGDKIWKGVLLAIHNIRQKDPQRANRMRARLDAFAAWWDGILNRFPDGFVDGLYMPDLEWLDVEDLDQKGFVERRRLNQSLVNE